MSKKVNSVKENNETGQPASDGQTGRSLWLRFAVWNAALAGGLALFLLLPVMIPALRMPCPFHDLLKLYCPFCGGTRAVRAVLKGQIVEGIVMYPPLVWLLGLFTAFEITAVRACLRKSAPLVQIRSWVTWATAAVFILFTIIRNILLIAYGIDPIGDLIEFWPHQAG
ncbi:MAG: DUF2752 domain-containing protein [Clostridia bacterium]|nr:DUF2752 domain-containing protein [Clostridia bacterium]